MTTESVLRKLAEEIGLMQQLGADRGLQYRQHKIEGKLRSVMEPILAENAQLRELLRRYDDALKLMMRTIGPISLTHGSQHLAMLNANTVIDADQQALSASRPPPT